MSLADDLLKMVGVKPRFPHVERDLAQGYGLAPDALKEVRSARLQRPLHWDLVKGLVCYNDEGKAVIEAALNIVSEKNPPPTTPPPGFIGVCDGVDGPFLKAPLSDSAPNTPPPPSPPEPKKFKAPKPGEIRTLVAVAKVRNKRILKARDQDRVAWVRVRDSQNFRPGMELQASFLSGEQWEFIGRCPRGSSKH